MKHRWRHTAPTYSVHRQCTRFRFVLAALVLAATMSGLWPSPRGIPSAEAAPNFYLNVTGHGLELQNVIVVNLYWDHDQGTTTLSKLVLDYLTESIIGSGYFADAAQYSRGLSQ